MIRPRNPVGHESCRAMNRGGIVNRNCNEARFRRQGAHHRTRSQQSGWHRGGHPLEHESAREPDGRVLGVDLAGNLLRLARVKASRLGLAHAEFRLGDIEAVDPVDETFDAVICVFGIVF
jgi:hypothetical protein